MFSHLRTKLAVLYAGLFGVTLLLIALAVYTAVRQNAERMVRSELVSSGAVFDRIWALRTSRLHEEAEVLSHDFGFRAAVATGDRATIISALDNLRARLGIDAAFVVGTDGQVVSAGDPRGALPPSVIGAVQDDPSASGVFALGEAPYFAASAPVAAPSLVGVVVFATRLDRSDIRALQRLAAIPLKAVILSRKTGAPWTVVGSDAVADPRVLAAFAGRAATRAASSAAVFRSRDGPSVAQIKPLPVLGDGEQVSLLVYYPLSKALAPFNALLDTLIAVGAAGLVLVVAGSWALARTLTRPVSALDAAVRRLQRGEDARVKVATDDEIGRLALSFNAMAENIRDREQRLERAKDLAEAANRAKSSFLANMSHEVRTPLNGVLGVANVLASTRLDGRQRQMVGVIESSASTLQRVLSDVLDVARMEAGRLDLIDEPFAIAATVRRLADAAGIEAQAKGLAFTLEAPSVSEQWVSGDRVRVEQILGNLLGNALKFTETGAIRLTVEAEGPCWRFGVSDTGIGFDPALTEQLFQPFLQADASITRRFGGTGLGLSIARDLARAMGGELVGEGRPGGGAAFTLTLPLPRCPAATAEAVTGLTLPRLGLAPPPAVSAPIPEPDDEVDADALRILVADDHEINRTVVQLILESVGVELVAVENGAEAVAAFKAQPFDLVLMDIQMPVMDGLTAVRMIRDHERAVAATPTPIVVLSANAMPEHLASSSAAGADDHLAKPVLAPVLLAALERALSPADHSSQPRAAAG